ncbi:1,4-dihydroxy-2-naphthoate prenyltransferase [Melghirimyces profundicolus]|uniref:1,4-dihydroxy-2-naphthoate octaprenyltransferase n=1 Tax=Melghirimyces profundicolus TaxID=1242148 RepID=A0A2T6C4W2_9BACL|nr:1,4-dihydroxy-2-naphthoate polyprenyltransferase [Melghirimyces profundicolus]PTX63356.1 1,4-dihydroxy-2-naphthoate prenyltransferase [Melghirimyces profundicolus]
MNRQSPTIRPKRNWRVWWQLLRPHTLTASIIPVLIGTALAFPVHRIDLLLFLAMLTASILIQAATNMFNEYYDYKRGLDNEQSVGIGGTIVRHKVSPRTVMGIAVAFCAAAVLLGVYICMNTSWWLAVIGSFCIAAGYFYTGGPVPIAYTPLGEVSSGLFMGLGIILIAFFIQTGTVTMESILISIPIAILVGAILMANNIRDREGDAKNGRKTLAILLGHEGAVRFLGGMFAVAYLWILILVLTGEASPWLLLVFISLPKAVQAVRGFTGKTRNTEMMPAMKFTAQVNTLFGFLLALGLFLGQYTG